jgi:hypothetical protein
MSEQQAAQAKLLNEFQLNDHAIKLISNQLGQEPYNMIRGRDGQRKASTRWSRTVEQIWYQNNNSEIHPSSKSSWGDLMDVDGEFSRHTILSDPVFRTDLHNLLRSQLKQMGYHRCFSKPISRTDYVTGEKYETLLIQVPVP